MWWGKGWIRMNDWENSQGQRDNHTSLRTADATLTKSQACVIRATMPWWPRVSRHIQYGRQFSFSAVLNVFSPAACIKVASNSLNNVWAPVKEMGSLSTHSCLKKKKRKKKRTVQQNHHKLASVPYQRRSHTHVHLYNGLCSTLFKC